jgi:hypothetical protein
MKTEEIYYITSEQEFSALLPELNKREIEAYAMAKANDLFEQGEMDEWKLLAITARNKAFWETFEKSARKKVNGVPERNYKAFGCEFSTMNTGDRKDYSSDPIYADLENQLKQRKDLLDVAFKSTQPIYDEHGAEVPKVPIKTYGGEVLKIKF